MLPDIKPGVSLGRQPIPESDINEKIKSIYDSMASEGRAELKRLSMYADATNFPSPGTTAFEKMPDWWQMQTRRGFALMVFGPAMDVIRTALRERRFDPWELYGKVNDLISGTGVPNPLQNPDSSASEISEREIERMQKIYKEDQTGIRFFNLGLPNLPHAIRRELRRSGMPLLTIRDEIIFEYISRLEKEGIPIPPIWRARMAKKRKSPPKNEWYLASKRFTRLQTSN